jgi:hypothetical protein
MSAIGDIIRVSFTLYQACAANMLPTTSGLKLQLLDFLSVTSGFCRLESQCGPSARLAKIKFCPSRVFGRGKA